MTKREMSKKFGFVVLWIILILFLLMPIVYIFVFPFAKSSSAKPFFSGYAKVSDALSTAIVAVITGILAYLYWRKDKILKLIDEYNDLSETRVLFWDIASKKYKKFLYLLNTGGYLYVKDQIIQYFDKVDSKIVDNGYLGKKLDMLKAKSQEQIKTKLKLYDLIIQTGFPMPSYKPHIAKFNPENIYVWIDSNINNLCVSQTTLLLFAFYCLSNSKMDEVRRKLAFFWYKWASISSKSFPKPFGFKELYERYNDSNHPELFLLTWLEIALAYRMGRSGRGKVEFLELSRYFWENRRKDDITNP